MSGSCIGIQMETLNIWEARSPLGPKHVADLIKRGVKVIVQPSGRRCYSDKEFQDAGATISDDLSPCNVIFGIKHPKIQDLLADKTYCFFSHTIKGQPENMPVLDACLEKHIRLVDYEKMCTETGTRLVAFSQFAGKAGMVDIIHGIGLRLLSLGHYTPFMHCGLAHSYKSTEEARKAIRSLGQEIARGDKMPKSLPPLIFIFTGAGKVSEGAQSIFKELPHEFILPDQLPDVAVNGRKDVVYGCQIDIDDHMRPIGQGKFDLQEFIKNPTAFKSTFAESMAPYASVIVNGIYWHQDSPRLITVNEAKTLFKRSSENLERFGTEQKLIGICDVSCDIGGSMEFMTKVTTIDKPFVIYNIDNGKMSDEMTEPGVLICSIDNMPAQFPSEATDFFGDSLMPYLGSLIKSDARKTLDDEDFNPEVKEAVIASNGSLTDRFKYIEDLRKRNM